MTPADLIAFEESIAEAFNRGEIRHPVHLESGNEQELLDVFKDWKPGDWCFGSWRMHSKALLAGVPAEELRVAIYRGESMALNFPGHRVLGSAIVGGTLPIAVGVAMAIKRRGGSEHVWCFLGDMTAEGGQFSECSKYAFFHELPITFIIEDNGISVLTPTKKVWKTVTLHGRDGQIARRYTYESKWPHAGAGKRVEF